MMGTAPARFKGRGLASGARGAESALREEQVLPGLRLVGEVSQQVGRVVGDDERDAAIGVDLAAQACQARLVAREADRGGLAQRDDVGRIG